MPRKKTQPAETTAEQIKTTKKAPAANRKNQEVAALKKVLLEKENELAAVYQVNEALREEVEQLSKAGNIPLKPQASPLTAHRFTLDGETFGFKYPAVMYKGQKITPVEIMADENLQRELLGIKSGMLKKLDS